MALLTSSARLSKGVSTDFNSDFEDSRNPDRQRHVYFVFGFHGACEVCREIFLMYDTKTWVKSPKIRTSVVDTFVPEYLSRGNFGSALRRHSFRCTTSFSFFRTHAHSPAFLYTISERNAKFPHCVSILILLKGTVPRLDKRVENF